MNAYLIIGIVFSVYILLSAIELIGLHRFNLKFYNNGFKVFEKSIKYKFSNWKDVGEIYQEREGEYVFITSMKVGYFVTNFNFYRNYILFARSVGIPLTIFGKIIDENNEVKLLFYISYRIVFMIVSWFLVIILLSAFSWTLIGLMVGAFGIVFTLVMLYFAKLFYRGKMLMMADEIATILKIRE